MLCFLSWFCAEVWRSLSPSSTSAVSSVALSHVSLRLADSSVWCSRYMGRGTKVRLLHAYIVLPALLYILGRYGSFTVGLRQRLNSFLTTSLRCILGFHLWDHVSNVRVLEEEGMVMVTSLGTWWLFQQAILSTVFCQPGTWWVGASCQDGLVAHGWCSSAGTSGSCGG